MPSTDPTAKIVNKKIKNNEPVFNLTQMLGIKISRHVRLGRTIKEDRVMVRQNLVLTQPLDLVHEHTSEMVPAVT